jgi:hypothetical protein
MLTYEYDVAALGADAAAADEAIGTQSACFTGTKVHILLQKEGQTLPLMTLGVQSACFTGTKVQILALLVQKYKF